MAFLFLREELLSVARYLSSSGVQVFARPQDGTYLGAEYIAVVGDKIMIKQDFSA